MSGLKSRCLFLQRNRLKKTLKMRRLLTRKARRRLLEAPKARARGRRRVKRTRTTSQASSSWGPPKQ